MKQLLQSFQAGARRLGARLAWSANMSQVPRPIHEEDLAWYRPGGYHPVRIGDHFNHGKYKVLNKLGYGSYSTVWLARNNETKRHVALKVLAADTSKVELDINELDILLKLTSKSATNPGTTHVLGLLDHFEHRGPHGDHLCLVSKPMGPDVSIFITEFSKARIPVATVKKFSKQLLLALSYLHDECQAANILIESPAINRLFEELASEDFVSHDVTLPPPDDFYMRSTQMYTDEENIAESSELSVRLADFGTASWFDHHFTDWIQPEMLRAPEVTLWADWDHKVDIWNLGLVIWELTHGAVLFDGGWTPQDVYTAEAHLAQMTALLGAFPKSLLSRSRERDRYFDSDGNLLKPSTFGSVSLDGFCKGLNADMPESDRVDFLDFIKAMIRLDPAERPDAKTLLGHKWIQGS
ncbi:serine protein kinase sky1 [Colletotrichum kahawae]|uniref:non-specific serine/threonine protein kinase n=1 Tax=Colletotrichum kahawae TaxID=34407 RepID=A0AAE0DA13_COLKA|nr:serine protein kinase sky1 [Colletotrichum kahawae]